MSCRYPGGVASPDDLWRLVAEGRDAVSVFPADRGWPGDLFDDDPAHGGTSYAREGGFLYDAAEFDAEFFGMSPREATATDPQQRLLLEIAWEAFERAGIVPESVRGSRTGVFAGVMYQDYATRLQNVRSGLEDYEGYLGNGSAGSVASGRIAYAFGLEGPAITVDTACSSSLVALHLACQSLRQGECDLALAGGVAVLSTPALFVEFSRQRGLAADGRCKSFADAADGTGWGEGAGLLLVERLSDARRNGHPVLAVVRGSAVNQDGASNGLTAPNGPAQQRVILQALANAGLTTSEVDAVEAHGTGTTLGDPIEAQALLETYGQDRSAPLWLGSLKSNIGHTQAAAGVGGVIKMVMAMRHGVLPKTLHVDAPSSHVDWTAGSVELLTESREWTSDRPLRAAVSSFGVSGTNAHAILEHVAEPETEPAADGPVPWVLSGRTPEALRAQAAALLGRGELPAASVGAALVSARSLFRHRAVVVGDLAGGLTALADGTPAANVITGEAGTPGKVALVFPGQGAQWAGMALELAEASPVFAARLDECGAALASFVDWSLREVLADAEALSRVDVVQPALFAVMVSLAELWRSFGVVPDAVVGHSQGEIAAAVVSGALSLEDGARVVALRSKAILALAGGGGMVSVAASHETVQERLIDGVSVAAVNGPTAVVVSGVPEALDEFMAACRADDIRVKRVPVDYASHSPQVEQLHDELREVLASITPCEGDIAFISTVTGEWNETVDAEYWYTNLRSTVRLDTAIERLKSEGFGTFVEASPHPVLTMALGDEVIALGSLRRDDGGLTRFHTALAEAHVNGVRVDWTPAFPDVVPADLPTYAFQRERYWLDVPEAEPVHADPADQRFWEVVGDQDVPAFAGVLDLAEDAPLDAVLPALAKWRSRRHDESTTDSWRYRIAWRPVTTSPSRLAGRWRVFGDGDDVREILTARGAEIVEDDENLTGVVAIRPDAATALELTRVDAPLWLLTEGAVAAGPDDVPDPAQAQVWGLGRIAGLEHPARWGGLVDLPPSLDETAGARLAAVLTGTTGEDQVAVRASGVFARRLVHAETGEPARRWRPEGTVLVTDADGHAAVRLARWLIARGATRIVLAAAALPGVETLRDAEIVEAYCDVADRDQLAAVLEAHGPVRSVFHTAGVTDLAPLAETGPEQLERARRVKAGTADHLDALLPDDLDAFVLFSSIAAVVGSGAHGAYAAANAHLDALAERRRARGATATSIAWGVWDADEGVDRERLVAEGVPPLDPELALTALGRALDHDDTTVVVADVDWVRFAPAFAAARPRPLLAEIPEAVEEIPVQTTGFAAQLAGLSAADAHRALTDLVRAQAAAVLGHASPAGVDVERAFSELGFDSLTAVELRTRLATATGLRLPTTLVFDHPNSAALTAFLLAELTGAEAAVTAARPVRTRDDDPIVVVGMGCRYPGGAASPDEFWDLVAAGRDAVGPFPADRGWDLSALYDPDPDHPGTTYARAGGFLSGAAEFDAAFFGMSPREAVATDAQQRLLLETSWEALEHAGIDPATLRGSATGVFAGVMYSDYGGLLAGSDYEGQQGNGSAPSVASGRVAYTLGLEGPAVTVDTACSSSLVALHWASQALRSGECTLALAGGVTVMATPATFVEFARQRGLSPDGRCKAFSDDADGTGWAEGVGLLVLERQSDALRNGHRILAVVRGSAVNQDGASNGLTAPNGPSQQRVIRAALAGAGLSTSDIDVVEAHGTGTALGDPIEAQALLATYGQDRSTPLLLGSVKSNIGHTQAAAGVAGIIKMIQAMRHGVVPASLHAGTPSSHVDWSAGAVEVVTESRAWPTSERLRRAGISSFGISGTNAHVIIEQAPEVAAPAEALDGPVIWPLSARSAAALRTHAARLASTVEEFPAGDVGRALSLRSRFAHRAVVVSERPAEALAAFAAGEPSPDVIEGVATTGSTAFLFSGQGAQRPGMGRELAARFPVFAAAFEEVLDRLDPAVRSAVDDERVHRTEYTQPALFAFEVAAARLLESRGVRPDFVTGHSVGEIAAAHIAGVLSLDDACALVSARARLMGDLPEGGVMIAIRASEVDVRPLLGEGVDIAAVNGPTSVVLSGLEDAVTAVADKFGKQRRLRVSHAFHSLLMDPMLAEFGEVVAGLTFAEPKIPLIASGDVTDPAYWVRHVRDTVRFGDALERLAGVTRFVEVGPDAVLAGLVEVPDAVVVPVVRRDRGEQRTFLTALARLHVSGLDVDWATAGPRADLPAYPFEHRRFWPPARPAGGPRGGHPVLGAAVEVAGTGTLVSTGRLSASTQPWLADHLVFGANLVPGTAFLELARHAGAEAGCPRVGDLTLLAPLVLTDAVTVQVSVATPDANGHRPVEIHSCGDDGEWTRHATGVLTPDSAPDMEMGDWPPAAATEFTVDGAYKTLAERGFAYGPAFQGLKALWQRGDELFAEVRVDEAEGFGLHPALLDAVLHAQLVADPDGPPALPFTWRGVSVHRPGATDLRVRLAPAGPDTISLTIADASGAPVASVEGLTVREAGQPRAAHLYRLDWTPVAGAPADVVTLPGYALDELAVVPEFVEVAVPSGMDIRTVTADVLALVQTWLADSRFDAAKLVVRTTGALDGEDFAAAAVWGLVRSARQENPGRFVLVDSDGSLPPRDFLGNGEPELSIVDGVVSAARVGRATPGDPGTEWDRDRAVLVTGGTSGLGALVARHLAMSGHRHLVLVSRSGRPEPGLLDDLADLGAEAD
ncbi:acyltransferase domain-containing protein, partial [Amycolatopsis sp. SID8362]|nr:acyltransferase domain-containing protein [Amycolatopsis sp. SID8362]NED49289.1 acyltransferase domain-containing protein [Amycolatopsis sp. SID8362]